MAALNEEFSPSMMKKVSFIVGYQCSLEVRFKLCDQSVYDKLNTCTAQPPRALGYIRLREIGFVYSHLTQLKEKLA